MDIEFVNSAFLEYLKNPTQNKFYNLFELRSQEKASETFEFIANGKCYSFCYDYYITRKEEKDFPISITGETYRWFRTNSTSHIKFFPAYFKLKQKQLFIDFEE